MRIGKKQFISAVAVLTLTMPVWARTYKQSLPLQKDATIGSAQLKPGEYQLTADDAKTELHILRNGKVVATVQGQWVKIQKPQRLHGSFRWGQDHAGTVRRQRRGLPTAVNPQSFIHGKRGRSFVRPRPTSQRNFPELSNTGNQQSAVQVGIAGNLHKFWPTAFSDTGPSDAVNAEIILCAKFIAWQISNVANLFVSGPGKRTVPRRQEPLNRRLSMKRLGRILARRRKAYIGVFLPIDRFCGPHSRCYLAVRGGRELRYDAVLQDREGISYPCALFRGIH